MGFRAYCFGVEGFGVEGLGYCRILCCVNGRGIRAFRFTAFESFQSLPVHEVTWEFPKLIRGPYNKDPTIYGAILGSPNFSETPTCRLVGLWGLASHPAPKP